MFLVGGPELNALQAALRPLCRRKVEVISTDTSIQPN